VAIVTDRTNSIGNKVVHLAVPQNRYFKISRIGRMVSVVAGKKKKKIK